jgi:type II secretory pathway pseudopilin PulG
MKKQTMITIIVIAIIAIIAIVGVVIVKNNNNTTNGGTSVKIESGKDMKSMLKSIYSENKDVLPELETEEIDVSNSDLVTSYTGIQSTGNVESLVVLEPLMSSQAYSAVALKVKSNANIETVKEEILNNVDMRKWICVSAEKLYVTNYNNIIFFVMSDEDWATATYNSFKEYVGNEIGKELQKSGEEDIEFPEERPAQ